MACEQGASLKGLFNIAVTPYSEDGTIDFTALAEAIERMVALKFDGLLIGGTYGEFPTLSPDERAELFRRTMQIVQGRMPVMLCSAASDPRIAADLTVLASSLGGYPMVTAPYVSEVTEEQIFEYFRWIAPLAKSGLVIYNAPGIGILLSARLIERLSALDTVLALKQGDLNPTTIDEIANRVGGRIKLFCASDLAFLGPVSAGFDGLSSTNSCAFPELISTSFRAAQAGDLAAATRLHRSWFAFREQARMHGQPQTVKAAMRARGWGNGKVRAPLQSVSPADAREIERVTAAILSAFLGRPDENAEAMSA
jgi:dihydrodipicolinate synthase/N-acetylneuraminate lyase